VETPIAGTGLSTPERIRQLLMRDIERGILRPGQLLDEKQLASRHGVSRTPVREALLMLTMQKLAVAVPRAGTFVHKPPADELIALLEFLGELESVAAKLAAQRMTVEQRALLAKINQESEALVLADDRTGYEASNLALHEIIYVGSGNTVIHEEINSARRRLSNFRRHVFDQPGRLRVSYDEHQPLVASLLAGDGPSAAQAMHDHIIGKGKAFADLVLVNK
jgi:DNA-binding GntR family transcriptional regulator